MYKILIHQTYTNCQAPVFYSRFIALNSIRQYICDTNDVTYRAETFVQQRLYIQMNTSTMVNEQSEISEHIDVYMA